MDLDIILTRLIKEHREFNRVLKNIERRLRQNFSFDDLELLREFLHREVDDHACWEEEVLYDILDREADIERIIFSHEYIMDRLRKFEDALDHFRKGKMGKEEIVGEAISLIKILKDHLTEEESILLPVIRKKMYGKYDK